jgi:hypothetical protein
LRKPGDLGNLLQKYLIGRNGNIQHVSAANMDLTSLDFTSNHGLVVSTLLQTCSKIFDVGSSQLAVVC